MVDHFSLLVLHALLISVFFAFLWKPPGAERRRYFVKVLALLVGGAIALGWVMLLV